MPVRTGRHGFARPAFTQEEVEATERLVAALEDEQRARGGTCVPT